MVKRRNRALPFVVILVGLGIGWWVLGREASTTDGQERREHGTSSGGTSLETPPVAAGGVAALRTSPFDGGGQEVSDVEGHDALQSPDPVLFLAGRVVDGHRYPRDGVEVIVTRDAVAVGRTRTDGGGRFRVAGGRALGPDDILLIHAMDPLGGAAVQVLWFPERGTEKETGTLVLGPAEDVTVRTLEGGSPVPGAKVVCWYEQHPLLGLVADASGDVVFRQLTEGSIRWQFLASSPRGSRGAARVSLPRPDPGPLVLELGTGRDVRVTVVDAESGAPIAGAKVVPWTLLPGSPSVALLAGPPPRPTDTDGVTLVTGVQEWDELDVTAPHHRGRNGAERVRIEPDVVDVRVELAPSRRVSWPVVPGELPVPPDGEVIRFRTFSTMHPVDAPAEGRISGGRLVVEGLAPENWAALAVAPDGGLARVSIRDGNDTGAEISFRRPRRVEVRVWDPLHAPVAGVAIDVQNGGNQTMAPHAVTDAEGRAVLGGFWGGRVSILSRPTRAPHWRGILIGTVDLDPGDAHLDVEIGREQTVVLDVSIDGRRRLPATFDILVGNGHPDSLEEDAERGTVRFVMRSHDTTEESTVTMNTRGFPRLSATIPRSPFGEEVRLPMVLTSAVTLKVEVIPPPDHRYGLTCERWDERRRVWAFSVNPVRRSDDIYEAIGLAPGRYRVLDQSSGIFTEDFEILAGGGILEIRIDLSRTCWVKGRVILPGGADLREAKVLASGTGIDTDAAVRADGTFRIRVPGDRVVKLSVWHPLCKPHPVRGSVTLTGPRDDLLLELLGGPLARFSTRARFPAVSYVVKHRALLYRGEPEGPPLSEHVVLPEGNTFVFGGFEPGTYTLWIDYRDHAPLILRNVILEEGETDLGEITFDRGSSVRVAILTKPGTAAPRVSVAAWAQQAPGYDRFMGSGGEAEAVLQGLDPGRFKVRIGLNGSGTRNTEHEITVDGNSDVHLTYDAR